MCRLLQTVAEARCKIRKAAAEEERPSAKTLAAVDKFFRQMTEMHLRPPTPGNGSENMADGGAATGDRSGGGWTGDGAAGLKRARTSDGDEEFGDVDVQAEQAAKRQRHAATLRAQRMLRHNSGAWQAEAQGERAVARNDSEGRKACSNGAASSAPGQAAAMLPQRKKVSARRKRGASKKGRLERQRRGKPPG